MWLVSECLACKRFIIIVLFLSTRRTDGSTGDEIKNANVFIANLPKTVDEEQLKSMFAPYGEIVRSKILVDHQTGVSKGCGFILFSKTAEADWAISGEQLISGHFT